MIHYLYTTRPGDTLSRLSLKYYGDKFLYPAIYDQNKDEIGPNPDILRVGTRLWMPPSLNNDLLTHEFLEPMKETGFPTTISKGPAKPFNANKLLIIGGLALAALALLA